MKKDIKKLLKILYEKKAIISGVTGQDGFFLKNF